MKSLTAFMAFVMLAGPAAVTGFAQTDDLAIDSDARPGHHPEFRPGVDAAEEPAHGSDIIPGAAPALPGEGLEYISSYLWTDQGDLHVEDGKIYCSLTYGLLILDATHGPQYDVISRLYLQTTSDRAPQLEKHGDYVYFTRRDELVVIDVSDAANPSVVGSYPCAGGVRKLVSADGRLYVAERGHGLTILDISAHAVPRLISTTTDFGEDLTYLSVSGDIAVTGDRDGFQVVDVSDPAAPVALASRALPEVVNAVVSDALAVTYQLVYDGPDSLTIFDLSDPENPVALAVHETPESNRTASSMLISGPLLITAGELIDISVPAAPVVMSEYSTYVYGLVAIEGSTLYKNLNTALAAYDIADVSNPGEARYHTYRGNPIDVHARGDIVYVASLFHGLTILDISDILHPVVLGELEDPYRFMAIDVQGDILFSGSLVVDVGDPANPFVLADLGFGDYTDVHLQGDLGFAAGRFPGIRAYDMTDPSDPQLLSTVMSSLPSFAKFAVKDSLVFFTPEDGTASVRILDYSDPTDPVLVGTYGSGRLWDIVVAVDGDVMYTRVDDELHVVDIRDPSNPLTLGVFDEFSMWFPFALVPRGDVLYTTDRYGNNVVFDVSDPRNPRFVENFETPSGATQNLFIDGQTLFLADYYGLMMVHSPYGAAPARQVSLDVRPGSCPNPVNWRMNQNGKAVLPVAICGDDEVDVRDIDISSLRLLGDLEPVRSGYEDVTAPAGRDGPECGCAGNAADGHLDLTLKFDLRAVLDRLHALPEAERYVLTISGLLADGERIEGRDCVKPVGGGHGGADDGGLGTDPRSKSESALESTPAGNASTLGAFPNPFNPTTEFRFSLPEDSHVMLDVYNVGGRRVVTLADRRFAAGEHTVRWDGRGASGRLVANGVYFCRLQAAGTEVTTKVLMLK